MDNYTYNFSVLLITYKQEAYIEQAIQSILEQDFSYNLQIVIGVDKSGDNTAAICRGYAEKHSNIEVVEHASNVGMFQNFFTTFRYCKGKYIAVLEGDDYWTNKRKLQLQYTYFEKNPDCILSAGLAQTYNQSTHKFKTPGAVSLKKGKRYTKDEIILANRFATLTTAFRASAINWENFNQLRGSPHLDWPLYLSLNYTPHSYVFKFNRVFGTYRMHEEGVYSQVSVDKKLANTAKTITFIHALTHENEYRSYLEYLYANITSKLNKQEICLSSIYKAENRIYNEGKLDISFLEELNEFARKYFFKLPYKHFRFRSAISLVHQTKSSYRVYFQFLNYPFIILSIIKYWSFKILNEIKND